MRTALLIVGFFAVVIPAGNAIAKNDSEPQGAAVSIMLFSLLALALTVGSNMIASRKTRRIPSKIVSLVSGAGAAGIFSAIASLVHYGLYFWPTVLTALLAAASLAAAFVSVSPKTTPR